ncbi:MAG: DUF3160 domain-containing protein, partial [Acidimicrobiia bacterium]
MRRTVVALACFALIAACTSSGEQTTATTTTVSPSTSTTILPPASITTTSTTTPTTTSSAVAIEAVEPPTSGFDATLDDVPLITDGTYPGPAWPASLDDVAFVDAVPDGLRERLVENGFVVEGAVGYATNSLEALAWSTQFSTIYEQLGPYGGGVGRPIFVTTDVGYHLWHQVFDFVLRDTEERQLLGVLDTLVEGLLTASRDRAAAVAGTPVEDAAARASEHLEAVATVLGLEVGPISVRAADEVALVEAHTEMAVSPTVGGSCDDPPGTTASCVDYSLMTPRGHYTRSEDLTRFFKAMSMLGNTGFSVTDVETLRVGLVIAHLLATNPDLAAGWATIYDPTAFLVGSADDYTPFEAVEAAATIGVDLSDLSELGSDEAVASVGTALLASRDVEIDPQRAS